MKNKMKMLGREVMEWSILHKDGVAKYIVMTRCDDGHACVDIWEKSKMGCRHAVVGRPLRATTAYNLYGWSVGYAQGFGWVSSTHDSVTIRSGVVYMDWHMEKGIA